MLQPTDQPLTERHDLAVLDLDGVVYVGPKAVPHAVDSLGSAREQGMHVAYVTNNAARPSGEVAAHLRELGLELADADVVTSAQAAARLLTQQLPAGAEVFVIGGDGLVEALEARGLTPVTEPGESIAAVVQGYGPQMPWSRVVEGSILVASGLPWVASNTDMTIPTGSGIGPGNGTLVELVARFADREPQVAGKPEAALFEETRDRLGGQDPLMIGDRLDTDIAGGARLGWATLLVMTGVTDPATLVAAPPELRPTYLGADLRALLEPQPEPKQADGGWAVGGWRAEVVDDRLELSGGGEAADWWRVVATAGWEHLDRTGGAVSVSHLAAPE